MTNRWKLWVGASALAIAAGAFPAAPLLSPIASGMLGIDLISAAQAQESGEDASSQCTDDGEEGGTDCPSTDSSGGEDGEGS